MDMRRPRVVLSGWTAQAAADRLGGSNLPSIETPSLKGRISEDGATVALVFGTGVGATTNAGPTLLETPSAFLDNSLGYAQILKTALGRVDLTVNLTNRSLRKLQRRRRADGHRRRGPRLTTGAARRPPSH